MLKLYKEFDFCVVNIDEENQYLETVFKDGTRVGATPNTDFASSALATHLGYQDTWSMSKDHELTHSWLANGLSPTLWNLAHRDNSVSYDDVAYEEAKVLDFQYNLDKNKPRPWEKI